MKPLTDEQARILRAIRDGRFRKNESCRYVIDGETRPERRERERIFKRHLCLERFERARGAWRFAGFALTPDGTAALAAYEEESADAS